MRTIEDWKKKCYELMAINLKLSNTLDKLISDSDILINKIEKAFKLKEKK